MWDGQDFRGLVRHATPPISHEPSPYQPLAATNDLPRKNTKVAKQALTSEKRTPPPQRKTTVVRSSSWNSENFNQVEQCARFTLRLRCCRHGGGGGVGFDGLQNKTGGEAGTSRWKKR